MNQYKYIPKNVEITAGETMHFRDGTVLYFNIMHDPRTHRLPVIQCGIEMTSDQIVKMYEHKSDATMKIDIYEQKLNGINGSVIGTSLYLQHEFSVVPMRDQNVYVTTTDRESELLVDPMKRLQNYEMYLVDMDIVKWFTQQIAVTYHNVNHAEALNAMFLERNIPQKIIVATPPAKVENIPVVSVPLQDLVHNIYHINEEYGLYDCIPFVYHDLKYLYCLSKRDPDIEIEDATDYGTVAFIVLNPQDPAHNVTGSYDDGGNKTHWVNLNQPPRIYDEEVWDTDAKFSTVTSVNSSGDVNKTTIDEDATALTYVYGINELSEKQMMNEYMTGPTVTVKALNSGVKFIKPYKDYIFATSDSYKNLNLDGKTYRLLSWTLGIHREGSSSYLSEVTVTLYNPKRKDEKE